MTWCFLSFPPIHSWAVESLLLFIFMLDEETSSVAWCRGGTSRQALFHYESSCCVHSHAFSRQQRCLSWKHQQGVLFYLLLNAKQCLTQGGRSWLLAEKHRHWLLFKWSRKQWRLRKSKKWDAWSPAAGLAPSGYADGGGGGAGRRRAPILGCSDDTAQGGMGGCQLQPAAFSFQIIPHCRGYGAAGGISGVGRFFKLGEWQGFGCKWLYPTWQESRQHQSFGGRVLTSNFLVWQDQARRAGPSRSSWSSRKGLTKDWMCVSSPSSYAEILFSNVMTFRGGTFGR